MNQVERYFLTVLGCAIRGEAPAAPPEGMDWDGLFRLADRHQLAGVAGGLLAEADYVPREARQRFADAHTMDLYIDTVFQVEAENLFQALASRKVAYAPFKGIVVKKLYPPSVIRTMGDIDILVRPSDMAAAGAALEAAGFRFDCEKSIHTVYFKEPRVWVELHSAILSHWSHYSAFYNDIWERMTVSPEDSCRYEMPGAYLYLTALLHFEKHLTNKGANVQQVLDVYTLAKTRGVGCENEDVAAILQSLGLTTFARNIEALARVWFEGGKPTKKQDKLGQLILGGGKGDYALHTAYQNQFIKRRSGLVTLRSLLLPNREELAARYPVLRRKPGLYPLCLPLNLLRLGWRALVHGAMALARLWLRLTGKTDWVEIYKEAHKKRLG